ncbi:hypothetical protein B0H13DRAFT_1922174 [Mycena leptocephala]|nr:hypothetical protein B0H13DRAFT_1922174 [Mycena leptocephala]
MVPYQTDLISMYPVYQGSNHSQNSSNSFSMLPSRPKIFHGRESELKDIIETLIQHSPRVAILGGGGMGKTSLARAALHHPDLSSRFEDRFFVSSESATNSVELAALIGLHVGLNPGQDLTTTVVQYFSKKPPFLLILDNLETPWEPIHTRGGIEEFLGLLTDIPDLALMLLTSRTITMRGAERPAKVAWTHPFLPPLQPLSDDAARQTFIDITDGSADNEDMKRILLFTDNMPLAAAQMSWLDGIQRKLLSSLLGMIESPIWMHLIRLSLSSPRITSGAKELLSLLSILPDGLSDVELLQSNLPIQTIRSCKATLIYTSLAYIDKQRRLRSLVPIREHIQRFCPPSQLLMDQLRKHFHSLLNIYKKYSGAQLKDVIIQITLNLGNLHQVLYPGLQADKSDVANSIRCVINLNYFHRVTGRSGTTLMGQIPAVLAQLGDHRLDVQFIAEFLVSETHNEMLSPELLISQGISHCNHFDDPWLECKFYLAAGIHHFFFRSNQNMGRQLFEKALKLSRSCGDTVTQCSTLTSIALINLGTGDHSAAQINVREGRRLANLTGNLYQEAHLLWVLAQCTCRLGDYQSSIIHLCRAQEILDICGYVGGMLENLVNGYQGEVHRLKSEYTEARSIHTQNLQDASQAPINRARVLVCIAQIDVMAGTDAGDVQQKLDEAKMILCHTKYIYGVRWCEIILADLKLREGDILSAEHLFQDCLNSIAQCLLRLGDLARNTGDLSQAVDLWTTARPLFERSSQAKDIAQIDARLVAIQHNQQVLAHLSALQRPETIAAESSIGVQKANIGEGEGAEQNLLEGIMISAM